MNCVGLSYLWSGSWIILWLLYWLSILIAFEMLPRPFLSSCCSWASDDCQAHSWSLLLHLQQLCNTADLHYTIALYELASLLMYCIREMLQLEAWFWVRFDFNWYQLDEHLRVWSVTTQKSFVGLNNPFNNMLAGAILMVLTFARQMHLSAAVHRHIFFHAHYTLWANSIESYKENHSNVLYLDISNDVMGESPTSVLCAWELTSMLQIEFVMFFRHTYISEYQLLITVIDIQVYRRMFLFWLTHISYDGLAMGFICQKLHLPPENFCWSIIDYLLMESLFCIEWALDFTQCYLGMFP